MNKISMDALNRGWSIGLGTQIPTQNPDFEAALAHDNEASLAAPQQRTFDSIVADVAAKVALFLATSSRQLASR